MRAREPMAGVAPGVPDAATVVGTQLRAVAAALARRVEAPQALRNRGAVDV